MIRNIDAYEAGVAGARSRFAESDAVRWVLGTEARPEQFERFLLHYSALGAAMTEPLAGWTLQASRRCTASGFHRLGTILRESVRPDTGSHALLMTDLDRLCAHWNRDHEPALAPGHLLATARSPVQLAYRSLFENVLSGPAPYAALAIHHEFEMLALEWGVGLLDNCARLLGPAVADMLTFLCEHAYVERGHALHSKGLLAEFLEERPGAVLPLGTAGAAAVDVYASAIAESVRRAVGADVPAPS